MCIFIYFIILVQFIMFSQHKSFYDTLEVAQNADESTIKRQYRKLAVKYHPDKNNGSEDATVKFQGVSRAYEVLSDPEKRKIYDVHGEEGIKQMEASAGGTPVDASDMFASMFSRGGDPFEAFFGGGRRSNSAKTVSNTTVTIDLKTLVCGGVAEVSFNDSVSKNLITGKTCTDFITCGECRGKGHVTRTVQVGPGMFQQSRGECNLCESRGYMLPPETADEYMWIEEIKMFPLELPAGVSLTKPLVLPGKGSLYVIPGENVNGTNVERSDLHVHIKCIKDENNEWQLHDAQHRHLQWTPKLQVIYGLVTNRLRCIHPNGNEYLLEMPTNAVTETIIVPGLGLPADASDKKDAYTDTPCGDLLIKVVWDFDTTTLEKAPWFQQMRNGMHVKAPWTNPIAQPDAIACLQSDEYQEYLEKRRSEATHARCGNGDGRPECVQS